MAANTTAYTFRKEPYQEQFFIDWNYVHSDKTAFENTKLTRKNQTFQKVLGVPTFVALPDL